MEIRDLKETYPVDIPPGAAVKIFQIESEGMATLVRVTITEPRMGEESEEYPEIARAAVEALIQQGWFTVAEEFWHLELRPGDDNAVLAPESLRERSFEV